MAEQRPTVDARAKRRALSDSRLGRAVLLASTRAATSRSRPNPDRARTRDQPVRAHAGAQGARPRACRCLIRFSDIVGDRIKRINEAFGKAIAEYEYPGNYRGVFPVKVNQQRHLVEEIVELRPAVEIRARGRLASPSS